MEFNELYSKSVELIKAFEQREKRKWGAEGAIIEMTKQVGELSKLIMVSEGYYIKGRDGSTDYQSSKDKIADELSDILLMVFRLAKHYSIDLEKEHIKQIEIAFNHQHMK